MILHMRFTPKRSDSILIYEEPKEKTLCQIVTLHSNLYLFEPLSIHYSSYLIKHFRVSIRCHNMFSLIENFFEIEREREYITEFQT